MLTICPILCLLAISSKCHGSTVSHGEATGFKLQLCKGLILSDVNTSSDSDHCLQASVSPLISVGRLFVHRIKPFAERLSLSSYWAFRTGLSPPLV
ncbi:MAG: hypothetical protein HRU19_01140 [Pseudobacteriovorax sp.]|nr:hypothetical protein [Pseudobacteriovorax sp.]